MRIPALALNVFFFLQAKAEEKKLLSQRTESHEESDQDEEPRENLQLNKESNPKDKAER